MSRLDKILLVFNFRKHFGNDEVLRCSFCNKTQDRVESLISNPPESPVRVYICDKCVAVCNSILEATRNEKSRSPVSNR